MAQILPLLTNARGTDEIRIAIVLKVTILTYDRQNNVVMRHSCHYNSIICTVIL